MEKEGIPALISMDGVRDEGRVETSTPASSSTSHHGWEGEATMRGAHARSAARCLLLPTPDSDARIPLTPQDAAGGGAALPPTPSLEVLYRMMYEESVLRTSVLENLIILQGGKLPGGHCEAP